MGEDEHRHVERRLLAPPSAPVRVIRMRVQAEHPGAHDLGADLGEVALRVAVVDPRRPRPPVSSWSTRSRKVRVAVYAAVRRASRPERVLGGLVCRRGEAVEGDVEVDANASHAPD